MQNSRDILSKFPGLNIYHQKIPSREVGRHLHMEHEFFMPLQGEITVSTQNLSIKAGPGRMLYVPPNLDHSFSSSSQGSGERVIWLIDQKTWKKHIGKSYSPYSMPINSLAKELIFYLLIHQKASGIQHFISALIESLGNSLETATLEKQNLYIDHFSGKIKDHRIRSALELMDKELDSISLTALAKQSGMSLRNFNRLFLIESGLNPKSYLILRRIEKAKKLLKESRLTVTDISLEVGYNSLSKFIETFKKITGVLPSDFRSQIS